MLKDFLTIIIFISSLIIILLSFFNSVIFNWIDYKKLSKRSVKKYIDNLSIEEFDQQMEDLFEKEEKTWLPENQHSTLTCIFCLEDSHIALCADKIGRPVCPECRELFDRVNKLFRGQQKVKNKKDWVGFIEQARNEIKTEKQHT